MLFKTNRRSSMLDVFNACWTLHSNNNNNNNTNANNGRANPIAVGDAWQRCSIVLYLKKRLEVASRIGRGGRLSYDSRIDSSTKVSRHRPMHLSVWCAHRTCTRCHMAHTAQYYFTHCSIDLELCVYTSSKVTLQTVYQMIRRLYAC